MEILQLLMIWYLSCFKKWVSIWQFWAELKELWSAFQRSSSLIQEQLLYWMALIARSFLFLIQFMSSYRPHFLLAISLILVSKKLHFILLTISLNFFQSFNHFDCLYISRSLWQLLFHQALEYFVMLTFLECLCYILSTLIASELTISSSVLLSRMESVLRFLIKFVNSSIKWSSSSLFLVRDCFVIWICSSTINMLMVIEVWSDISL